MTEVTQTVPAPAIVRIVTPGIQGPRGVAGAVGAQGPAGPQGPPTPTEDLIQAGPAGWPARRLATLDRLRRSMARVGGIYPKLAASLPVIGAPVAATTIATGTTWQVSDGSNPNLHAGKYTFVGAQWGAIGTTFPNHSIWKGLSSNRGNGTAITASPQYYGSVRWQSEAPMLELYVQCAQTGAAGGFRLKVDGEYVATGTAWGQDAVNGAIRFIPITWGDGGAAHRRLRHYELEYDSVGGFLGIRTANIYKPMPWPVADGLRIVHHGDSQVSTVVDTVSPSTTMTAGIYTTLRWLLGQPDYWNSGSGGTGWFAPVPKTASYANDRVAIDIANRAPDIVIDHMGGNDEGVLTAGTVTQAQYQAAVEAWIAAIVAANPAVVIFMFGPVITSAAPVLGHTRVRDAKRDAAALYPENVVFIDNFVDMWMTGTGRKGTTTGDGNRDWAVGSDNAHFTWEGCWYVAERMAAGIAGAIPVLAAANLAAAA